MVARHIITYQQDYSDQQVFTEINQEKNGETVFPLSPLPVSRHHHNELMLPVPQPGLCPREQSLTSARPATTAAWTSGLSVCRVSICWPEGQAAHPHCPSANGMEPSSHLFEITLTELPKQLVCKAPPLTPDCLTDWEA